MKRLIAVLIPALGLCACSNKPSGSGNTTPADGCYAFFNEKDTVLLQVQTEGQHVTGKLLFQYFAKDRNEGTITGEIKGDTLWAKYTFMSEGKTSTRDIVFLRKEENFTEGFGKLNEATGEPDFSDRAALHFDGKMILKKTDCAALTSFPGKR